MKKKNQRFLDILTFVAISSNQFLGMIILYIHIHEAAKNWGCWLW